ncbi:MAG TPA: hypothetical protein VK207_09350 [Bacteroidales bacterium]|nr:hypothetical protein [Bacteroidales bacterium]
MNYLLCLLALLLPASSFSQYKPTSHRQPLPDEIPVTSPGNYKEPGKTYILVNDISSPRSAIFLIKDAILDLNGYTITFADGNYSHVPNRGFEDGLTGWDISKAPGARIESTSVHAFIGKNVLHLNAGDEIVSDYVMLPEAKRSYCAICGVTGRYYYEMKGDLTNDMRVSIYVEDEQGREVKCRTSYADSVKVSSPVINRSPRLGGGFIFAHLNNLPAGRYRVRVKAETDCLVDEVDIRPSMDAGIGVVGKTHPYGHYDHMYNNAHTAFFDYTADAAKGKPVEGIPVSHGPGSVIIKNGSIKNGVDGFLSWGIQSTAGNVRVILDNVKIITSGINTTAVDVEQATITGCTFDVNNPFIINRHGSEFYGVDLRGFLPSEVSFSEFYGGQGCLSVKGKESVIHHNLFVNRQKVTNHYSIMAMGDGSRIFSNVFRPEIGSGIEIFRKKYIEIFDNEFHINAAPPSCEYNDQLSTNAIRIADYGASPGAENGAYGNRVYNNRFFVNGKKYKEYPDFIPLASAVFYSASAGENEIFGNEIILHQADTGTTAQAYAFYVGNASGGRIHDNRIVTNVTPFWIGNAYGDAENTVISGNTVEVSGEARYSFPVIRMGPGYTASGIELSSNVFPGSSYIEASGKPHSYKVSWTLELKLENKKDTRVNKSEVIIRNRNGDEVLRKVADRGDNLRIELPEYSVTGTEKSYYSPYTIICSGKRVEVVLDRNKEVIIK